MIMYNFPFALLFGFALVISVLAADDQTGFISLDCGLPATSTYSEPSTEIQYISDEPFIDTGVSKRIAPEYIKSHQTQIALVRSFPQLTRNCYRVNVTSGTKYLIRATFVYGNYDGLDTLPKFDLHLGPSFWYTIKLVNANLSVIKEVIHTPFVDYVHVCLVNTGLGTPFISSLELRPLKNITYVTERGSLALQTRLDVGSKTNQSYRYNNDIVDRIWSPIHFDLWEDLSTTDSNRATPQNNYQMPDIVMSTGCTPLNASAPLSITWNAPDTSSEYYVYMHFAEVQKLKANETRSFNVTRNDKPFYGPVVLNNSNRMTTLYNRVAITGGNFTFSLIKTGNSTLPPILNAIEYYKVIDFSRSETNGDDVVAITNLKSSYGVEKNWQGDPCAPQDYVWEGLNCSADDPPRITFLDLSSSGLTGGILSYIYNLDMLESLDLSNNSLTGPVPEFLAEMRNLKVLNLEKNNLNGSLPSLLIDKSTSGALTLRVGENEKLCAAISCKKKKKNLLIPVLAAVGGFAVLFMVSVAIFCGVKSKRSHVGANIRESNIQMDPFENFESKKKQFSYSEVLEITKNFHIVLGKGGFGKVYHGYVGDTQVAVKVLSPSSVQGYQHFQAEVKLLMRVHHRNLTALVGYCNEGTNMALLYEYMANGDLESHLLGEDNKAILSWERRLRIAADAAQGLEYLHNGSKPHIVHRDVKITNILLAENFQAKLGDFGLSRMFPTDGGTPMSTVVAGTPGYLDPEYHRTGMLNEKSDVYSFGVALLQIITSRPVITRTAQVNNHISQWVSSMLSTGDIRSIVDPKLQGAFEINSAWKVVELARDCMTEMSIARPVMYDVVTRLKECLGAEMARLNETRASGTTDSSTFFSVGTSFDLLARDLSSSGLTGGILSYIYNLDMLESLDLSNNSLTGPVPEFLAEMRNLKVLNLEKNNLNGSLPSLLIDKSTSGALTLRVGENEKLCAAISCKKKKKNLLIPVLAAVGGFAVLFMVSVAIFCGVKSKRSHVGANIRESNIQMDSIENFESGKRQFSYSEVLKITNNFQSVLGKGGFGKVYHGYVDDTQVAVKVLSPSSVQGYQQFQAEVKLLMRVHHKNLTALVGYCNEGTNMALFYEYMANGDLESHLLGQNNKPILSWESRLRVAADTAQGLEYLHNGSKPPIVHRDVKTTNILLAANFQAKLADFGLSRMFSTDEGTHMTTGVVGTPGYLDPEYHTKGRLNEKSDVYSFGVALLQIITSRPVITRTAQVNNHISQWVSSMLSTGDIRSIVDPNLRGAFEINSAWKLVELARDCMTEMPTARPNMSKVVTRLKECLGAEMARLNESRATTGRTDSSIVFSMDTGFNPSAR